MMSKTFVRLIAMRHFTVILAVDAHLTPTPNHIVQNVKKTSKNIDNSALKRITLKKTMFPGNYGK